MARVSAPVWQPPPGQQALALALSQLLAWLGHPSATITCSLQRPAAWPLETPLGSQASPSTPLALPVTILPPSHACSSTPSQLSPSCPCPSCGPLLPQLPRLAALSQQPLRRLQSSSPMTQIQHPCNQCSPHAIPPQRGQHPRCTLQFVERPRSFHSDAPWPEGICRPCSAQALTAFVCRQLGQIQSSPLACHHPRRNPAEAPPCS
mmetsp:Transcript_45896/g.106702  ORF Transcript_45896/g.106702 Transcript_45896/m.106702 type:complete len:206 (-) Transcript_45896:59-676(-)